MQFDLNAKSGTLLFLAAIVLGFAGYHLGKFVGANF